MSRSHTRKQKVCSQSIGTHLMGERCVEAYLLCVIPSKYLSIPLPSFSSFLTLTDVYLHQIDEPSGFSSDTKSQTIPGFVTAKDTLEGTILYSVAMAARGPSQASNGVQAPSETRIRQLAIENQLEFRVERHHLDAYFTSFIIRMSTPKSARIGQRTLQSSSAKD